MKTPKHPADSGTSALHALVRGRVQGVGFRAFVMDAARRMGCTGWVRNLASGEVEVYAMAPREDVLTELLTELAKGPPWSHVSDIKVNWEPAHEPSESFRILK